METKYVPFPPGGIANIMVVEDTLLVVLRAKKYPLEKFSCYVGVQKS